MRIGDTYGTVGGTLTSAASPSPAKSGASEEDGSVSQQQGNVRVDVSARALQLSQASSGVDDAKVSQLKTAIANGTFTIDSAKIAGRIVDGQ
jgi:flagellar biosynthesis anti-sigma factor FlgM